MDKTTITITTPVDKKIVVLKSFINGREKRALTSVFLNGEIDFSADAKNIKGIKGSLIETAEDLSIKTIVISVDGKSDDVVNAVLNMHSQDYTFIIGEINKITADVGGEEVKKN